MPIRDSQYGLKWVVFCRRGVLAAFIMGNNAARTPRLLDGDSPIENCCMPTRPPIRMNDGLILHNMNRHATEKSPNVVGRYPHEPRPSRLAGPRNVRRDDAVGCRQ